MLIKNRSEFVREALFANADAIFDSPVSITNAPVTTDAHGCA